MDIIPIVYRCVTCSAPAEMSASGLSMPCEHTDGVTADMTATAYGEGGAEG